ncbi:MAG TPA: hypothetical protein VF339_15850 [Gammaproteobacteria bacterium]
MTPSERPIPVSRSKSGFRSRAGAALIELEAPRREVAESSGFSLHAGIAAKASQRDKLERLMGYHSPRSNAWFGGRRAAM